MLIQWALNSKVKKSTDKLKQLKALSINLDSKRQLVNAIIQFDNDAQIHGKRKELLQQNQAFLKNLPANSPAPEPLIELDSPTKHVPRTTKTRNIQISELSLNPVAATDMVSNTPVITIRTNNIPTNNIPANNMPSYGKSRQSTKIPEYDLNGDRDFLNFNITEYIDKKLNRIGSKEDGKLLEKTLRKKGFELKAFRDGEGAREPLWIK